MMFSSHSNLPKLSLYYTSSVVVFYYTTSKIPFITLSLSYVFSSWFYCLWSPLSIPCFQFPASFWHRLQGFPLFFQAVLSLSCLFFALTSGPPFLFQNTVSHISLCSAVVSLSVLVMYHVVSQLTRVGNETFWRVCCNSILRTVTGKR